MLDTYLCTVAGCGRPLFCTGLCRGHYARKRRGVAVEVPLRPMAQPSDSTRCFGIRLPPELHRELVESAKEAGQSTCGYAAALLARAVGLAK